MEQKVIKIGNSIGIVIPKSIRKYLGVGVKDKVIVGLDASGSKIMVEKKGKKTKPTITPEFFTWVEQFNRQHADVLNELAKR